jgi:tRNA dimethylallyltransferase
MLFNLITVLGATATGKTKLAAELANQFNGEIISADSRQVYKGMNIGTGKDLQDYTVGEFHIKYHLIDIVDPREEFNLFEFRKRFYAAFNLILEKKKLPFLVGGTGLYLSAILQNYKLKEVDFSSARAKELQKLESGELKRILLSKETGTHNTTDLIDRDRMIKAILVSESSSRSPEYTPDITSFIIGIKPERDIIKKRITERLKYRLNNGMIEEVKNLIDSGLSFEKLNFFGLEYRYISFYLKGELNYNDMFQKLNSAIHDFAKRQMTWFRKMEREGMKIHWIESPDFDKAKQLLLENINV